MPAQQAVIRLTAGQANHAVSPSRSSVKPDGWMCDLEMNRRISIYIIGYATANCLAD